MAHARILDLNEDVIFTFGDGGPPLLGYTRTPERLTYGTVKRVGEKPYRFVAEKMPETVTLSGTWRPGPSDDHNIFTTLMRHQRLGTMLAIQYAPDFLLSSDVSWKITPDISVDWGDLVMGKPRTISYSITFERFV